MAAKVAGWGPWGLVLTSPSFWMAIGGATLVGGLWVYLESVEEKGYQRAVVEHSAKITGMVSEHKEAVRKLDAEILMLRNQRENEIKQAQRANHQLKQDYGKLVVDLEEKVKAAEKKNQRIKTIEVTKYVPKDVDSRYAVPSGFVRFHDQIAGADASQTIGSDLSAGPGLDVSAPSSVTFSRVATIVGENYGECIARRSLIEAWQQWYVQAKEVFTSSAKLYGLSLSFPEAPK